MKKSSKGIKRNKLLIFAVALFVCAAAVFFYFFPPGVFLGWVRFISPQSSVYVTRYTHVLLSHYPYAQSYSEIIQNRSRLSSKTQWCVRDFRLGRDRSSLISLYVVDIYEISEHKLNADQVAELRSFFRGAWFVRSSDRGTGGWFSHDPPYFPYYLHSYRISVTNPDGDHASIWVGAERRHGYIQLHLGRSPIDIFRIRNASPEEEIQRIIGK
ncbi:MAG: hypothetical protein FWB80_00775 [Defluviitaleaceae bacterium]|nr:hypothetical protein [Defluviitaleaceae bacterium]